MYVHRYYYIDAMHPLFAEMETLPLREAMEVNSYKEDFSLKHGLMPGRTSRGLRTQKKA
jgi:hypothetical protein